MNLRSKMILSLVPVLALLFIAMILFAYNSLQSSAQRETQSEAEAISYSQVAHFTDSLNKTYGSIATIARQLSAAVELHSSDRNEMFALLKKEIENNAEYLGVWTIWEPNAYDGRDQAVAQSKPADAAAIPQDNLEMVFSTESGAVNIYWVREGGNIVPVTGSDSQRQEPYYAEL